MVIAIEKALSCLANFSVVERSQMH